jgi:peroxin-6
LQTDLEGFVKEIVGQTSGFMPRDMCALIADAGASLFPRNNAEVDKDEPEDADSSLISKVTEDNNQSKVSALKPGKEDLVNALERSKKRNASALGTPKVN